MATGDQGWRWLKAFVQLEDNRGRCRPRSISPGSPTPGIAGPPTIPPLAPLDTEASGPSRRRPRPRYDARCRWSWLAGAVFGVAAVIVKLLLWHVANPAAFLAGLGAFVTATALWRDGAGQRPLRQLRPN